MDLFTMNMENELKSKAPLASRMRPKKLEDYIGQDHIVGEGKYLNRLIKSDRLSSMIFYGPPGVGKTTLADVISKTSKRIFVEISAVTSNIKQLREILLEAENNLKFNNKSSILFIDEIHRFNKTQQDALLPYVEKGIIILIGATTENPYFEVNKALLSRVQILNLKVLSEENLRELINRALEKDIIFKKLNINISENAIDFLVKNSGGDGRSVLNSLEIAVLSTDTIDNKIEIDLDTVKDCLQKNNLKYDKSGNEHYDTASAFIKSIRGSDPQAAIHYLARMIEAGEDPKFIARRLIISASEDISNADPMALLIANAAFEGVNVVGMPEARIILAQATSYLASAPKSNSSYLAINEALKDIEEIGFPKIPMYLRDKHAPDYNRESVYKYPHNYEKNYVKQKYLPERIENKVYYRPSENGYEKKLSQYLKSLKEDF
ncbi:MAG: replication-associated recombination protein A [Peptoniphilaceae bacterium]